RASSIPGTYNFRAEVTDSAGKIAEDSISLKIPDTTKPSISITSPTDNSNVDGIVTISVDTDDNVRVSHIELYVDDELYAKSEELYQFELDSQVFEEGKHSLKVVSYDTSGNFSAEQITINVIKEILLPSISIISPSDGAVVSGRVKISVSADSPNNIEIVKIYVDEKLKRTFTQEPFDYYWRASSIPGTYNFRAEVTDSTGKIAEDSITVIIEKKL
ncbi:MAG: Ig-like domain-containing protein, partial [Thermodesulfobacteriota bacterium]